METDDEQRIIDEALNMVFSCGITGYKLEKMIGFTQAAISKWRNKKSRPTARNAKDIIEKLSKILNSTEVESPSVIYVPLVGKYAYAGYLHGFGDDVYIGALPTVPFIIDEIGTPKGIYRAFEVRGDSMNDGTIDAYADGDLAICRLIDQSLYEHSPLHLHSWRDFVVVSNDGILIKRIIAHDVDSGIITLHSLNPMYKDFQLSLKDVRQIFNVIKIERNKKL